VKAARSDTGHPLGLMRALVHEDGHVAMLANSADLARRVEAMHALLAEFGLPGWQLTWLGPDEAVAGYVYGLSCNACRIRFSCGCDIAADIMTGRCPHGTAKAVHAAAIRCGYLEAAP
jgi:hypothetical protein